MVKLLFLHEYLCKIRELLSFTALYENLLIDGYFTDVLTSKQLPHDEHEIVLQSDASWEPLVPAKPKTEKDADDKPAKR